MSTRAAIAAAFVAMLLPATAGAQPGVSVESGNGNDQTTAVTPLSRPVDRGNSTDTLLVLDRLHSYGYTINTEARADRAIRSWQRSNRLVVDGIVGQETLASLRLTATATAPAVRTTPPPPPAPAAVDDVESIIRAVWPDDVEDHAVAIAWRESRLVPTVHTWCCFGVMQIHKIHLAWLCPQLGICTADQLYDPTLNAEAALALYGRDGWTPWSL